ncbi:uncharacterized protein LOC134812159 [Bolinopsis microptera]|uniref:uncharacterized protein LOC134812159 n=1 Tax=Bolinopsis microptera TaxID=2820187 RepID=UPI00307A9733
MQNAVKIPRPKTLKVTNKALRYTLLYFGVFGGFGLWFKQWHASYLRCGLPKEEWQNYDEAFKNKEDKRWNIDRKEIQPDYYKDVSAVQNVKKFWKSLTGAE